MERYNRPYKVLSPSQLKVRGSNSMPSMLSVGARAIIKHIPKNLEGFWGENKGSEQRKNEMAVERLNLIMS